MNIRALISVCMLSAFGCAEPPKIQRSADDPFLTAPAHQAFNVKVHFTDSSMTKAMLYARESVIDENRRATIMRGGVTVDLFTKDGSSVAARLTSDSLVVDDRSRDMTAYGNVKIDGKLRPLTMTTTKLTWVHSTARVQTIEPVHIETPSETIDGIGFESNQDLSFYRISQVRGIRRRTP